MKTTFIIITFLVYKINCGLLSGLTDSLTNELHTVSESLPNVSNKNEGTEDSSQENTRALTKGVDFLGKGAQTLTGGIDNVLGFGNKDQTKPGNKETKEPTDIKANKTVSTDNSTADGNSKVDSTTATDKDDTSNVANEDAVNSTTETSTTKSKDEKDADGSKKPEDGNVKVADNSTNTNDKEGKSADNAIPPDMIRSGSDEVPRTPFDVACMEGFVRTDENTCQPVD